MGNYQQSQLGGINQSVKSPVRERSKGKKITECIGFMCYSCKMMRAKLQGDNVLVNLVQNEMIIKLCDSFSVNNTHRGASYDSGSLSPCEFG